MASEFTADPFEDLSASPPPLSNHRRKNWQELRQAVRKTRRLAASLINRIPHSFTFRHIETDYDPQTRLYFLGIPAGSRENTLLYVDLPQQCDVTDQLEWQHLLDSFQATPLHGQFSKEEQLLRERKRLGSFGITSYDYNEETGRFVFPACNSLFYCNDMIRDGALQTQPTVPLEAKSSCIGARLDPKMCPGNPDLLAFIHANDVWVTNLSSGHEQRLTFAHKGLNHLADDPCSAGVPSFVVQEEFDRYTGYWWQPQLVQAGRSNVYHILYEEVDESAVEILTIQTPCGEADSSVDEYRYPRAGTPNAKCNLKILEFQVAPSGDIVNVSDRQLVEPLSTLFPWMEYIPRAGWTPDGNSVYVELLDRAQQKLQLVLIPLECFCVSSTNSSQDVVMYDDLLSLPPIQVIYEDVSSIWVNVHDSLHFFRQTDPSQVTFIWASEKSGYRHLYQVTSKLASSSSLNGDAEPMQHSTDVADLMRPNVIKEVQLTSGPWETLGKKIWVDEERGLVYFIGLKDTPLETHLFVVSFRNPSTVVRLTEPNYSHTVSLDKDCRMFMSVFSNINQAPASQLYSIIITDDGQIKSEPVYLLLNSTVLSEEYHPPELFSYNSAAGCATHGMFYRPHDLEVGKKYPTVLFVYGGPQVQLVTNAFKGIRFLRLHTLASLGYTVVVIDTRGSCHRGLHFECHIKHQLGTVEIADQVEGLQWLASQVDFIDLNRVAIHGWSYGGYLSLMGLCQRPDIFKVAVAGAPVTSWLLYDTGYTERYMASPDVNPQGYKESCVLEHAHNFPSDGNRLLIVHGLIDENVHFFHTSQLVNALVKACKPYQLQVYPNERHGIRNPDASEHYETMVLNFLQENL